MRNKLTFSDLSHLQIAWRLEAEGTVICRGELTISQTGPGETEELDLSTVSDIQKVDKETWWTISATTLGCSWAEDGHEVAWAQFPYNKGYETKHVARDIAPAHFMPRVEGRVVRVGPGNFDVVTGRLNEIGTYGVASMQLDIWRAPTDNDSGGEMNADWPEVRVSNLDKWLDAGLDRLQHQVQSIALVDDDLVVRLKVGMAVLDRYMDVTMSYHASNDNNGLRVKVEIIPRGDWKGLQIPRVGVLLALQTPRFARAQWYGLGPGEAYPDTSNGAQLGLHDLAIDEMQTPYVMPQENGNRALVRFANIVDKNGNGLKFESDEHFNFTVRRWTSQELHSANRRSDLIPSNLTMINIDHAMSGIGSASTGPGVLEKYQISFEEGVKIEYEFTIRLL